MTEPDDSCRPVEIDGELIRVRGSGEMSDEAREALGALIRVAKEKFAAEHPETVVTDPERRERYAEALYATLEVSPVRHPWETLNPLRRAVWYHRADAAMALADAERGAAPPPTDQAVAEPPLLPDFEHPECGFHWHGRDGMDIPVRDGQPVCPRCELAAVERRLRMSERRRDELREESLRRGRNVLEYSEKIRMLEREIDGVRRQLGAEILRANTAETELRRMADEARQPEGAAPVEALDLADGPVRCPLCPNTVTLHTSNGVRAHFTTVHPEQRLVGPGPWPLLATDGAEAANARATSAEAELKRLREESPWLKATAEDLAAAQAAMARVRVAADALADGTEIGFRAALAIREALDKPCAQHPTAPRIGGMCGHCTQYPSDMPQEPTP